MSEHRIVDALTSAQGRTLGVLSGMAAAANAATVEAPPPIDFMNVHLFIIGGAYVTPQTVIILLGAFTSLGIFAVSAGKFWFEHLRKRTDDLADQSQGN